MSDKPLVGVSTCLLGEKVRYDGENKLDPVIRDVLGAQFEFIAICPELECGMGVPREAMWLVKIQGDIQLKTQTTGKDMTSQMERWMQGKLTELSGMPLCGYIFKSKSPSCGLTGVTCYTEDGDTLPNEPGIFAKGLMAAFPTLPVAEESRLHDRRLREIFIEKVFNMQRQHRSS